MTRPLKTLYQRRRCSLVPDTEFNVWSGDSGRIREWAQQAVTTFTLWALQKVKSLYHGIWRTLSDQAQRLEVPCLSTRLANSSETSPVDYQS